MFTPYFYFQPNIKKANTAYQQYLAKGVYDLPPGQIPNEALLARNEYRLQQNAAQNKDLPVATRANIAQGGVRYTDNRGIGNRITSNLSDYWNRYTNSWNTAFGGQDQYAHEGDDWTRTAGKWTNRVGAAALGTAGAIAATPYVLAAAPKLLGAGATVARTGAQLVPRALSLGTRALNTGGRAVNAVRGGVGQLRNAYNASSLGRLHGAFNNSRIGNIYNTVTSAPRALMRTSFGQTVPGQALNLLRMSKPLPTTLAGVALMEGLAKAQEAKRKFDDDGLRMEQELIAAGASPEDAKRISYNTHTGLATRLLTHYMANPRHYMLRGGGDNPIDQAFSESWGSALPHSIPTGLRQAWSTVSAGGPIGMGIQALGSGLINKITSISDSANTAVNDVRQNNPAALDSPMTYMKSRLVRDLYDYYKEDLKYLSENPEIRAALVKRLGAYRANARLTRQTEPPTPTEDSVAIIDLLQQYDNMQAALRRLKGTVGSTLDSNTTEQGVEGVDPLHNRGLVPRS